MRTRTYVHLSDELLYLTEERCPLEIIGRMHACKVTQVLRHQSHAPRSRLSHRGLLRVDKEFR